MWATVTTQVSGLVMGACALILTAIAVHGLEPRYSAVGLLSVALFSGVLGISMLEHAYAKPEATVQRMMSTHLVLAYGFAVFTAFAVFQPETVSWLHSAVR